MRSRGKAISLSVCRLSVVPTKIARSRRIGISVTHKHNESVEIVEKPASSCFKSFGCTCLCWSTREEEVERRIPFLDTLVERKVPGMKTSVYRKPTNTDRYIHYSSNHQRRVLRGTLCSMRDRAHNLCRDSTVEEELTHLSRVFQSNGYPSKFVRRVLDKPPTRNIRRVGEEEEAEKEENKPKILYLPYVRGVNERIERGCKNLGVRTVFKSRHTLRQTLMNVKSKTPGECKRGAVYEIPCADCDSVYIGETGRSLKDRIKEHKYAVSRGDMKNGVAAHAWTRQHKVDWSSAKVRSVEQFLWKRKVLEAIHIQRETSTSNLDCGLQLNPIWTPILNSKQ